MKPIHARLAELEKRKTSHHYIPGTKAFDEAIRAFFWRVKARACEGCLQAEEAEDDEAIPCIQDCSAFDAAESDEAELLDRTDILQRILWERVTWRRKW